VIFAVQAMLLVPYIIIGVMAAAQRFPPSAAASCRTGWAALVALVVMSYVVFGGMRGAPG